MFKTLLSSLKENKNRSCHNSYEWIVLFKGGTGIFCYTAKKNQTSSFLLNASKANHTVFSTGLVGVRISVVTIAAWLSSILYFYQPKALFSSLSSNSPKPALWKNLGHFKWHLHYWNHQGPFLTGV